MKHNALHKILCFYLSFIMWQQVSAQQDYDSSFRFYYYDQKLSMFLLMPHREEAFVWLGDSITDGGEWGELFPGMATLNRGISADNILAVNEGIKQIAGKENTNLIDLNTAFADTDGKLDTRFTNDGLHLTGAGYLHWKQILENHNALK